MIESHFGLSMLSTLHSTPLVLRASEIYEVVLL